MSYVGSTPPIPSKTNRSWDFVDTVGPPPPPQSTVSTTPLMENHAIPPVPGSNPIMTPNASGTQYILVSAPFVSAPGPSTSATYRAPYNATYNMVITGPLNNPFDWNPLFSSNPQVQMPGGTVSNMHIPTRNVTDPPPFTGHQG